MHKCIFMNKFSKRQLKIYLKNKNRTKSCLIFSELKSKNGMDSKNHKCTIKRRSMEEQNNGQ